MVKPASCSLRIADGRETIHLAKELRPDVAIIDVAMPRLDGIEAVKQVKEACPKTAILMISAYDYDSYILASLQAGAAGYLLKSASLSTLASAIRMVHCGESVLSNRGIRDIMSRLNAKGGQEDKVASELHRRELEVLKLVAKGLSNREIAAGLFISERTVQSHLANIFKKLEVGSRTEAVVCAIKRGWLAPE